MPSPPTCRPYAPAFPLETERLLLRALEPASDLAAFLAMYSREDVVRHLYTEPLDEAAMHAWLAERASWIALRVPGDCMKLAAVLRETGAVIGEMTLWWKADDHAQGEIGFVLHPDHQGRGYAAEGSRRLLSAGFDEIGFHRILGRLDSRNTASARVLEALGMRREADLRENEWVKSEWTDETVYALLASEWQSRR